MDILTGRQMDNLTGYRMECLKGYRMDNLTEHLMDYLTGSRMDILTEHLMDNLKGYRMDILTEYLMDYLTGHRKVKRMVFRLESSRRRERSTASQMVCCLGGPKQRESLTELRTEQ